MSSLNAMRPAQTGQIVIMPEGDLAAYRKHLETFVAEYKPKGATESHLVQSLADTAWRLNRVAALEATLLSLAVSGKDELQNALSVAAALEKQAKALSNLSMHSQRLSRQFERTLIQLRDLQNNHRQAEASELEETLDVMDMFESKHQPFDPAAHGFVFSETQIADARRARHRRDLVRKTQKHYESAA